MGCGMSRSNLMDDFGSRSPFHHKPADTAPPPKLLMNYDASSQPPIVHQPPVLQKINTTREVNCDDDGRTISNTKGDGDPMWFGSPSFREYVQPVPDNIATKGDEQGGEAIVGTHGGQNLTCNREVCVWGDSTGKTQQVDRKDTRGGRFRKVFQVHRVTLWHGGAWHAGHQKATRKAA